MFGLFKRNHVSKKTITKSIANFNDMINSKLNDIWMIDNKNNLLIALYTYVSEKCNYGINIEKLSGSEKTFFLCQEFESEINNGGFSQLYYNTSGNYCYDIPTALNEIGALVNSNLMKEANSLFDYNLPRNKEEREIIIENLMTEEVDHNLGILDLEFYKYQENLTELNYNYVMKNKENFF